MNSNKSSRRDFLKIAGLVGAGLSTTGTSLFNLRNIGAASSLNAPSFLAGEYKALVCLYLGGGADSFNMVVPTEASKYNDYANTRSNLALSLNDLLPVSPLNVGGLTYGFHPSMVNMQSIFNQGKMCFINNIGTLINPLTKQQFYDESVPVPLGLFSHSDQTNQWHTAIPNERDIKGWAGRMGDLLYATNTNQNISMNISFNGINTFQTGNHDVVYTIGYGGASGLTGYDPEEMYNIYPARRKAIDTLMNHVYNDPFKDTYTHIFKKSLNASIEFDEALEGINLITEFTDNYLSNNFKMIARVIAAREKLGFTRQIFFVDYGNWDMHDELIDSQRAELQTVDTALGEFYQALQELNMLDNVVTFSMSEFGRTLTSNGNGTDHAWGGNAFAMGGPVKGNNFYGNYPSLALGSDLDIENGVLIPTTPTDLYFAELALWFGVSPSELTTILPNIGNFYGGSGAPIGFLKS